MQNNENNIDGLFKDGLASFEVTPPPVVWDRISETMGHKKRKTKALWWWTMSGAASIIFAFIAGWYLSNEMNTTEELFAEMELLKKTQLENIVLESPKTNDIQLRIDQSQFTHIDSEPLNENSKATQSLVIDNSHSDENILANAGEYVAMDLMNSRTPRLTSSNNSDFELIQDKNRIDDLDKKIIEANLLAINTESHSTSGKGNWLMGIQASPVYRFEQVAGNQNSFDNSSKNIVNSVSTAYEPNMAGGLSVTYETGKKLAFITGVNYNEVSQNSARVGITFSDLNWLSSKEYAVYEPVRDDADVALGADNVIVFSPDNVVLNTNVGTANIVVPKGIQINYNSKLNNSISETSPNYDFKQAAGYVEVPLLLKYILIDKRVGLHLLGGINTNILVSNNVKLLNGGEVVASGNIEYLSPVTYSSSIGMGMNFKVSERFRVNIDPTFKIQLSSLNVQANFNARPYAFGVFSGITYQF